MRNRDNRNASMELLLEEIKDAGEEIVHLAILKKSHLIKLNPCIDDDGVIRSDG